MPVVDMNASSGFRGVTSSGGGEEEGAEVVRSRSAATSALALSWQMLGWSSVTTGFPGCHCSFGVAPRPVIIVSTVTVTVAAVAVVPLWAGGFASGVEGEV